MKKEYFKIMFAQMHMDLICDNEKEYVVADDKYFIQMDEIIKVFGEGDYDILILPELAYHEKYDEYFLSASVGKLIVFGSVYLSGENRTVVYQDGVKHLVRKMFNSGVEPAIRFQNRITVKEFLKNELKSHTFTLHGRKFIVLNCSEYYKTAYFIARDERLCKNLFGFLVPCANNNSDVFLSESIALHNHNDMIYSFVVNSISEYNGEGYAHGSSFVFGRISKFERSHSSLNRITNKTNNICLLDDKPCIVTGEYLFEKASSYYRSDNFRYTPKNIQIRKMGIK